MRVIMWKMRRISRLASILFAAFITALVLFHAIKGPDYDAISMAAMEEKARVMPILEEPPAPQPDVIPVEQNNNVVNDASKGHVRDASHPSDLPIFLGFESVGEHERLAGGVPDSFPTGPGEGGVPHVLQADQHGEEGHLKGVYGFNQLVSDHISLDRTVPDLRADECPHWEYPVNLPKASVILVLHNEGWTTLLRTVHSVLNRSPAHLLEEVLLVDDKSELEHLHQPLESELLKPYYNNKVRIVRNAEREGLIRARNNGAMAARGEVLVFLDSHCEVNYNWLPPLLAAIHTDHRTLAVPLIDGIDWNTFEVRPMYGPYHNQRGIFEWGFMYKESTLPQQEASKLQRRSQPYPAPTHAGGLFAINKRWFETLGYYDDGLYVWGGENFELSFKTWMCGGRSVWVPCSRVAHVYRGHSCSSCHAGSLNKKFQGVPVVLRNYKRVVETWFDGVYKDYFYTREPVARYLDMGDISKGLALKERLQCKSFEWFMKEVAYDVLVRYPPLPPNKFWGEIRHKATNQCIDGGETVYGCHGQGGNQLMRLNTEGQLATGEMCRDINSATNQLTSGYCQHGSNAGPWEFRETTQQLYHTVKKLCLTLRPQERIPEAAQCMNEPDATQIWELNHIKPLWAKD